MPLPDSWNEIPITGTFTRYPSGDAAAGGRIEVRPLTRVIGDSIAAIPALTVIKLDANGEVPAGTTLASVNDTAQGVEGVYYKFTERFPGGREPYTLLIPYDSAGVNIATAPAVVPAPDLVSVVGLAAVLAAQEAEAEAEASAAAAASSAGAAATSAAGAASAVADALIVEGSDVEPDVTLGDAVVRNAANGHGGTIAFMFDDGYRSNYLYALPVFRRYGFAATIAVEIDKIGQDYNSDPAYPVCTAADLRELIAAGWEVCNHPALTLAETEANMVSAAATENQLLVDLLTGAKVKNYTTGAVTSATPTHPELAGYPIKTAVYRGGSRSDTSDKAYRFLFDKVRSINGTVALRGDHLYAFAPGSERTMQMSGFPVDISSNPVETTLAFIDSVAQTNSQAILYGHDTPSGAGGATPYISAADLESVLQRCRDRGVAVVPLARLYKGNAIADSTFEDSTGVFGANSGDTAAFSTSGPLNNATRCVELTATAYRSNNNTNYQTKDFVCEPFCRYRIRVRYSIGTDLTLNGGTGNRNHGLNVQFQTSQGNTAGYSAGDHILSNDVQNDSVSRLPYLATTGYEELVFETITGYGQTATVRLALYQCTGTVKIGQIIAEKLDSLIDRPLSGTANFNTTIGSSTIYLPTPNVSNERQWDWEFTVFAAPTEPSATYTYAFANSASIATPTEGQTCYVIGVGAGDFASQGGKLATYTTGAWAFSIIPVGTFFKVTNGEGIANRRIRHFGIKSDGSPLFQETFSDVAAETFPVKRVAAGQYKVFNTSGVRTDAFTWVARPRAI